jgi:hypothetical protein
MLPRTCPSSSNLHRKKRFTSFPSPAGMSLTKLPLARNNSVLTSLFPHRESLVVTSRLGTGNKRTFFTVYTALDISVQQQPLLPLDVLVPLQETLLPVCAFYSNLKMLLLVVSVLHQPVLPLVVCLFYGRLCCI